MLKLSGMLITGFWFLSSNAVFAASINRTFALNLDPVAPASATYEDTKPYHSISKWGFGADFNIRGAFSTGPEIWIGNFKEQGPDEESDVTPRREDFQQGESHKIDAFRLRWTVTRWEVEETMRGWYLKAGYSYTRVNSRAKKFYELRNSLLENQETDLITDIRHGAMIGVGERWGFFDNHGTFGVGISMTQNFKRVVSQEGKDPDARADYDTFIEDQPEANISVRPMPELNVNVGYLW